jgi:hypothetical protein
MLLVTNSANSALFTKLGSICVFGLRVAVVAVLAVASAVVSAGAATRPGRVALAEPLAELIYEQDATTGVIEVFGAAEGHRVHTIPVPFGLDPTGGDGGITFDRYGDLFASYTYPVVEPGENTVASTTAVFAGPRPWISVPGSTYSGGLTAFDYYLAVAPSGAVATEIIVFHLDVGFIDIQSPAGRQLVNLGDDEDVLSLAYLSSGTLLFSYGGGPNVTYLASIAPGATTFQTLGELGVPGVLATDGANDVFIYDQTTATQGSVTELHFPGPSVIGSVNLDRCAGVVGIAVSKSGKRAYLIEREPKGTRTVGYNLAGGGGEPILNHYEPNFDGRYIAIRLGS